MAWEQTTLKWRCGNTVMVTVLPHLSFPFSPANWSPIPAFTLISAQLDLVCNDTSLDQCDKCINRAPQCSWCPLLPVRCSYIVTCQYGQLNLYGSWNFSQKKFQDLGGNRTHSSTTLVWCSTIWAIKPLAGSKVVGSEVREPCSYHNGHQEHLYTTCLWVF